MIVHYLPAKFELLFNLGVVTSQKISVPGFRSEQHSPSFTFSRASISSGRITPMAAPTLRNFSFNLRPHEG